MSEENKKDLYCSLAFNSISFGPNGGSRPCCAVDTYYWHEYVHTLQNYQNYLPNWFNNQDMVKLRKDMLDNKWNPICNLCKMREEVGQESTREIFNRTLSRIEEKTERSWRTQTEQINNFENIFLLDITTGNKCNSACLMCNESASSLWAKEQLEITGQIHQQPSLNWFSEQNIIPLVDQLPNLHTIQFAGGEPTIHEAVPALLKHLIDQGRSKNISLGFVTNLTGISDELLELWSHFDKKHITISIDGVGKVNEYIRYPFAWKKVMSNWESIKNIAKNSPDYFVNLSHTVTSLNLYTFGDIIKWWETQLLDVNLNAPSAAPHIQCVNNPSYLDPKYAPRELKQRVEGMLVDLENYLDATNLLDKYKPAIENIRNNVLNVDIDDKFRQPHWKRMKDFISSRDRYRNRNIFDYLPYMKEYWSLN